MESLTESICRYFHWWFRRWHYHVTVRLSQFESLSQSVGKIVWKNSTLPHHCIFPNKLYRPSAIRSVYTDNITDRFMLSIYTDRFWDGIISVSNNYRWKNFVGNSVGFRWFSGSVLSLYMCVCGSITIHVLKKLKIFFGIKLIFFVFLDCFIVLI
jgi:hypothetical protein